MKGSLVKRGRQCDVTVTKTHLKCTLKNNLGPNVFLEIPLSDILAVQSPSRDGASTSSTTTTATTTTAASATAISSTTTNSSTTTTATLTTASAAAPDNNNQSVVVHYAGRRKDSRNLTWEKLLLSGDAGLCSELNNVCNCNIAGPLQKPRQFLVLINPYSGRKAASRIFHKKVAPLFRACGVTFRTYETRGPRDAGNAFRDVDFSTLDGIIVVGGDGFYSEVLTALVLKQQQLAGLSADDPEVAVSQFPVPVGIIPGGSGNYVTMYLHGSKDPVTAAIKVLMGKTTNSNVTGVYQGGKLQECAGLICSFGLLGDIMHECERFRWMGNFRYKVIPIRSILGRRIIPGRLEYLHAPTGEWRELSGQFYSFDMNVVDLVDNGQGLIPTFGPDANILHVTSTCSLGDHLKGLKKLEDCSPGAYDFPFLKNEPVLRYRVTLEPSAATGTTTTTATSTAATSRAATPSASTAAAATTDSEVVSEDGKDKPLDGVTYYVNCDGEALPITRTRFEMRVHRHAVKLFGERQAQ